MTVNECVIAIDTEADVARAVSEATRILKSKGFDRTRCFLVATAVSELARNIFVHAEHGRIVLKGVANETREGVEIISEDQGPGIEDIELALTDGYSSRDSLGLGLPGVRRIMDELEFDTDRPTGIRITARKWK